MKTSQFEGVKVAIKQDRTGYVLTLSVHPDEIPNEILRDFVGARYQVVMVRLGEDERPVNRDNFIDVVKISAIVSKDPQFYRWLDETGESFAADEAYAIDWLYAKCGIKSRAELRVNGEAAKIFLSINEEFKQWKNQ
jgi:hypothetical protein